jgi:hypothetical protein
MSNKSLFRVTVAAVLLYVAAFIVVGFHRPHYTTPTNHRGSAT